MAATSSWAQVNRCIDVGGKVIYTDGACINQSAKRDDAASRHLSGVKVEYYDVRGREAESVLGDLARRGPRGFHGLASWRFNYDYRYAPSPGGRCRVQSVSVAVSGQILIPRWLDEPNAPVSMQKTWSRYQEALMRHEEGHIANGQALIRVLRLELERLTAADCVVLQEQVKRIADGLLETYKARDRQYDAETQHGITQGAQLSFQ